MNTYMEMILYLRLIGLGGLVGIVLLTILVVCLSYRLWRWGSLHLFMNKNK